MGAVAMRETSTPTVSIIVVSYNTREQTIACLESVLAQTKNTSFELIVVDNASVDGSKEAIEQSVPSGRLIASTVNLGFAAANNLAAKHATGEYLLLLNPDTVILDDAIGKLVAFSRRYEDAQIWGGRTLFGDLTLNPSSCSRRMTIWNQFCRATGLGAALKSGF
jgi:N-acetylglucosaminyl-diphospho-decaprenol L-rhamnosyltransferase